MIPQIRRESKSTTIERINQSDMPSEPRKTVKEVTGPQSHKTITLLEKQQTIRDEEKVAKIFNHFFKDKIEQIEKRIPTYPDCPTDKISKKYKDRRLSFQLRTVSEKCVRKVILSLKNKNSSGIDFISPKILKSTVDVITTPLTHVINSSIAEGIFPESWKIAKVIPVFKNKGSKEDKTMYRPVSNLKSVSKVIEMIVNHQVLQYFERNKLLPNGQHGFRANRSTFSAIASMHDNWLDSYNKGKNVAISFFDLSSAFDTLSKDIFCKKLEIYGFDQKSVKWFESYLSDRQQLVMIGTSFSETININIGSPQGAILSTTICIILIADIGEWSEAYISGYADDTTTAVSNEDYNLMIQSCEKEASNILKYMAINRLAANEEKTHIMIVKRGAQSTQNHAVTIGDKEVKATETEKLLGIIVSDDLTWKPHIDRLVRDLNHRIFKLRILSNHIPRKHLKTVADGIFMSKLRYGLALFGPVKLKEQESECGTTQKLKVAFNKVLRLICGKKLRDKEPIEKMLKETGWLSLNQLSAEGRLIELWKAINNPESPLTKLVKIKQSQVETRAAAKKTVEQYPKEGQEMNKKLEGCSFRHTSAKVWNSAPKEISEATTLEQVKPLIRKYVEKLPLH